jgi:hypothetical protein
VHAALGDKDEAFRLLFRAIDEPQGLMVYVKTHPPFDSLHTDPRWAAVLRRMNYPSSTIAEKEKGRTGRPAL